MGIGESGRVVAAALGGGLLVAVLLPGAPATAATGAPVAGPQAAVRADAVMPWFLAPSLGQLRSEVNRRWPSRSRSSDGTIGDLLHRRSRNSHNPVGHPYGPVNGTPGAVHGIDITAAGIDVDALLRAVIGDSRVWYVIYDGRIWSRTYNWAPGGYSGDPHRTHIHVSLREESPAAARAAENDTSGWLARVPTGRSSGLDADSTRKLQRALISRGFGIPAGPTGLYGSQTRAAVAAFQRSQGWSGGDADGVAGPETLRRLGLGASAKQSSVETAAAAAASRSGSSRSTSAPAMKPGEASARVRTLQRALIARGYRIPAGATGYFGSRTRAAVRRFQQDQGWTGSHADGIPGPGTLRRLSLSEGAGSSSGASSTKASSTTSSSTKSSPSSASAASRTAGSASYRVGEASTRVHRLQKALIARGYSIPAGATGYFGSRTLEAVKTFQRDQGWSGAQADGVPGPGTLRRLGL